MGLVTKDRSVPWQLLGIAFCWAWGYLVFYTPTLLFRGGTPADLSGIYTASSVGFALTIAGLIVCARPVTPLLASRRMLLLAATITAGSTLGVPFSLELHALAILLAVLTGVGSAFLTLAWGFVFGSTRNDVVSRAIPLAVLLMALLVLLSQAFSFTVMFGLVFCLPYLSALFVPRAESLDLPQTKIRHLHPIRAFASMRRFLFCIFAYGVVLGCFRVVMSEGIGLNYLLGNVIFFLGMAASSLAFALSVWRSKDGASITVIYKLALPITVAALLTVTFLPEQYEPVSAFLLGVGFVCFDIGAWILIANAAYRTRMSPALAFGWSRLFSHSGITAGALLALATNSGIVTYPVTVAVIVLLLVSAVLSIYNNLDVLDAKKQGGEREAAPGVQLPGVRIATANIADCYGLTSRESEILDYLLAGRDTGYIERELVISNSTAKTHVRHIYEKLGIHGRQELLELADRLGNSGRTR